MSRWPLRVKLTLWSALITGLVMLACAMNISWFLRTEQLGHLDEQLHREAQEVFSDLKNFGGGDATRLPVFTADLMPPSLADRFIELRGRHHEVIFRSENLKGAELEPLAPREDIELHGERLRLGIFHTPDFTLFLATDLHELDDITRDMRRAFLLTLPFAVCAVMIGGYFVARRALKPIGTITAAAEHITAARLDERLLAPSRHDELGRLATVFNSMLDRLDAAFRRAKRFTADASHELRTPLTVMRAGLEDLLRSRALTSEDRATARSLLDEARRLSRISDDLLLLTRVDAGSMRLDLEPVDFSELISACVEDGRILGEPRSIGVESTVEPGIHVNGDHTRLPQIVLNLLDNAVKYNFDHGRIRVSLRRAGPCAELRVANAGPGIERGRESGLFQRFHRAGASEETRGAGLGLSIAQELAVAHGGDLQLSATDAAWTEFCLTLPVLADVHEA